MQKYLILSLAASFLLVGISSSSAQKTKTKATKSKKEIVVIETNMGKIELLMWRSIAPKTVENFVQLAKRKYYDGVTFHRVISNFMIQGGDPRGDGTGGESIYGRVFENETNPKYTFDRPGLLAMANAGPNTNGSQFFITLVPTPHLNNGYSLFGEVVAGMDVVQAIGKVKTGPGDKPVKPVIMKKVYAK